MPPVQRRNNSRASSNTCIRPQLSSYAFFSPVNHMLNPLTAGSESFRRVSPTRSSPYPRNRASIAQARTVSKTTERARRVLGEMDWWAVMSGQREDYDSDEELTDDEYDSETAPGDEDSRSPHITTRARIDTVGSRNSHSEEDTISEPSEADVSVEGSHIFSANGPEPDLTAEPRRRAPSPFFPTTLPPLAPLLSSQVGAEPSRRGPRPTTTRVYAARPQASNSQWAHTASTMNIAGISPSVGLNSSSSRPPACRPTSHAFCRTLGIASGPVSDDIVRGALSATATGLPADSYPHIDVTHWKFRKLAMAPLAVSSSILTFR